MSLRNLLPVSAFIFAVLAPQASADVHWLLKEQTISAAHADVHANARYEFYVTGDTDVVLGPIRTSCDCTASTIDRLRYRSGETGVIAANFDFGHRTGWQEKRIYVTSTQGDSIATHELTMLVFVPRSISIDPDSLVWKSGADAHWKTAEITITRSEPVSIDCHDPTGKFVVIIETDLDPRFARVRVRPKENEVPVNSFIEILIQTGTEKVEFYTLPVSIVP